MSGNWENNQESQLAQELNQLVEKERRAGVPEFMDHVKEILDRALEAEDKSVLQYCYTLMAESSYLHSNMDGYRRYLKMVSDLLSENVQNFKALAIAYNELGIDAANNGNYVMAVDDYHEAMDAAGDNTRQKMVAMANLAMLYSEIDNNAKAIELQKEVVGYYAARDAVQDQLNQMICYCQMGEVWLKLGNVEEAGKIIAILDRNRETYQPSVMEDPTWSEFEIYYYFAINDLEKADFYIREYLGKCSSTDGIFDCVADLIRLGGYLVKRGDMTYLPAILDMVREPVAICEMEAYELMLIELQIEYYKAIGHEGPLAKLYEDHYTVHMRRMKAYLLSLQTNLDFRESKHELLLQKKLMEMENARLQKVAETDPLTGLANRKSLREKAAVWFAEARERGGQFGIEILDLDYFKQVNDTYGHDVGDRYLKEVSAALQDITCDHISVGRYGGDEFCIIYRDMTDTMILEAAEQLHQLVIDKKLENASVLENGYQTISQGIYNGIPVNEEGHMDFFRKADKALYEVKESGRGRILMAE